MFVSIITVVSALTTTTANNGVDARGAVAETLAATPEPPPTRATTRRRCPFGPAATRTCPFPRGRAASPDGEEQPSSTVWAIWREASAPNLRKVFFSHIWGDDSGADWNATAFSEFPDG
ncbi:hypothetical protein GGS23DRAFT_601463 [Durotheca rogersii]|uniref:uncharacterized protein n=1 Tax=Durotheca rogersii TaxID=419775 RepID=UPI00221F3581|nr:uncharacterized protein GGS23DRAFT_601463 [Durotheca rogersii]KAI5855100.1 hypothetical protein GGS23DRAFT_601463 [Durotheca rogersii]